jgi:transcriptional regulator with XRE-family HTH domain
MPLIKKRNRLRDLRIEKGLSGYDLQILSHIPAQLIYLIERGIKNPQDYEKVLLSEALDIPVEKIFPKEMENNPKIEKIVRSHT